MSVDTKFLSIFNIFSRFFYLIIFLFSYILTCIFLIFFAGLFRKEKKKKKRKVTYKTHSLNSLSRGWDWQEKKNDTLGLKNMYSFGSDRETIPWTRKIPTPHLFPSIHSSLGSPSHRRQATKKETKSTPQLSPSLGLGRRKKTEQKKKESSLTLSAISLSLLTSHNTPTHYSDTRRQPPIGPMF